MDQVTLNTSGFTTTSLTVLDEAGEPERSERQLPVGPQTTRGQHQLAFCCLGTDGLRPQMGVHRVVSSRGERTKQKGGHSPTQLPMVKMSLVLREHFDASTWLSTGLLSVAPQDDATHSFVFSTPDFHLGGSIRNELPVLFPVTDISTGSMSRTSTVSIVPSAQMGPCGKIANSLPVRRSPLSIPQTSGRYGTVCL